MTLKTASAVGPVRIVFGQADPGPASEIANGIRPKRTVSLAALKSLAARPFRAIFDKLAPVGYEDENGFHYGVPDQRP